MLLRMFLEKSAQVALEIYRNQNPLIFGLHKIMKVIEY